LITWGSKYLLSISGISFLAAAIYGIVTGGSIVGVASAGYKGGVGDHFGYTIAISLGLVLLLLAIVGSNTREGISTDNQGNHLAVADMPEVTQTFLAPVAAFGIACLVAGFAFSQAFLILGVILLGVVALQWALQAWAENISDDEEFNSLALSRVSSSFDVPMYAMLVAAFVILGVSRILLAVPAVYSTVAASVIASIIFVGCIFLSKTDATKKLITSFVAFGAIAVLVGGIVAAGIGERDFSHHGEEANHSEVGALPE